MPVRDPSYLFDTALYKKTGTLFFQDYWQPAHSIFLLTVNSLVWELLGIPFHPRECEMESGQLLVDKRRSIVQRALVVVLYLAMTFETKSPASEGGRTTMERGRMAGFSGNTVCSDKTREMERRGRERRGKMGSGRGEIGEN